MSLRCGRAVVGTVPMLFQLAATNTVHGMRRPLTPFPKSYSSEKNKKMLHDFIVKRAVDFVPDLNLHSLRAPDKNARHFYSCFQARILPPSFLGP